MQSIGIIGAGLIGRAIAAQLARRGIVATIANSRGPDSLAALVRDLGPAIIAGTREAAAAQDIVFVAVKWSQLSQALSDLPDFSGRIVIDMNNPIEAPLFEPIDVQGPSSSDVFADLVPGARVVKAFNHLLAETLEADPEADGGKRVLFCAGDDAGAKAVVAALIGRIGFFAIDLGPLTTGGSLIQYPGGPLAAHNLVRID